MAAIGVWFPQLEMDPPVYDRLDTSRVAGRDITKYVLHDQQPATINRAVAAVMALLQENHELCPVFPLEPEETLRGLVMHKPYLTVNGKAVCLAKTRFTAAGAYKDRFFSETNVRHPVHCEVGHLLEQKSARLWAAMNQNLCPVLPQHGIGTLQVDEELEHDIAVYKQIEKDRRRANDDLENQQRIQNWLMHIRGSEIIRFRVPSSGETYQLIEDGGKILLKTGVKKACSKITGMAAKKVAEKGAEKVAEKVAERALNKSAQVVLKSIPVVSLCTGVGFGIYRLTQGERWRALGEVVSGAVACVPGWGTAASVALDVAIASGDVYALTIPQPSDEAEILSRAYFILGIDIAQNAQPTRDDVDHAFRAQVRLVHPDILKRMAPAFLPLANYLSAQLYAAKDFIYRCRGWRNE